MELTVNSPRPLSRSLAESIDDLSTLSNHSSKLKGAHVSKSPIPFKKDLPPNNEFPDQSTREKTSSK